MRIRMHSNIHVDMNGNIIQTNGKMSLGLN